MHRYVLGFALLVALTSSSALADGILVGNNLVTCAAPTCAEVSLLPIEFTVQPFTLNASAFVDEVVFIIANGPRGQGSPAVHGLPFEMQLTNAVGPSTTPANVMAQTQYVYPDASTATAFAFVLSVDQQLAAGNYFLVASTTLTDEPGELASVLSNSFDNLGNLGTVGGSFDCAGPECNSGFPPGSAFPPISPPLELPFQFQVCADDTCLANVNTNVPAPVPEPSSMLLLGTGILGLIRVARRRGLHRS